MFDKDPETKARFNEHLPFQVFSCWNGAVTFSAEPFLLDKVAFRAINPGECYSGEPELLCKDFWYKGYGKIAVVPSVSLEYTDESGMRVKASKGYTSEWVDVEYDERSYINWNSNPPDQVKCLDVFESKEWRPWNETLA